MGFVIDSSAGGPLSQQAMRRLVEVVDACRGEPRIFVVFKDSFPYQAVSVHKTEDAAKKAAKAESKRSYLGPVAPKDAPKGFYGLLKVPGTTFEPLKKRVATVVLLDADNAEVDRLRVTPEGELPNVQEDIEALLFTPSSVDKYAIPYLTRVFDAEFAAQQRRKWLR
jgi:hypothetical protein